MAKDRIPTSRISRTARVTGLAAGQAARQLGTATTNLARGGRESGSHPVGDVTSPKARSLRLAWQAKP